MNRKIKKLFKDPKAYFYDYFRKKVRNHPSSIVSYAVRAAFANAKTDLGYGNEVRRLLKAGELDMAEKICQEGMTVVPRSIRPFALYAEVSMRKGDFMEATRRWKVVVERFPNKVEGYAREVRAYIRLNDLDHAEKLCLAGMKRMSSEPWPYSEYAEISMLRRDWPEAASRWAKLRERFPQNVQGYIRAAHAFIETESYADAESLCKDALERFPDDIWSYQVLAEISMRQKDYNEALNRWQKVRDKFPNKAIGYVRASVAYSALKEYKEAEDLCRKCMEIAPNDTAPFSEFAEISMRKGDFKEALSRWKVVRDKFPDSHVSYVGGGRALLEQHEFDKAEAVCIRGLEATKQGQSECRNLYYSLIDIYLNQTGRAVECISIISDLEQTYSNRRITDKRYYNTLVRVLFFMLGRDCCEVKQNSTDFIIIRLLNQPLYYGTENIFLNLLLDRLSRYDKDLSEKLKEYIQVIILENNFDSLIAILISSATNDEDRTNAYLKIIRLNCFYGAQLCSYHPNNVRSLEKACDEISKTGEYKFFRPDMLYHFARVALFANQDKGEKFISEVYEIFKDKNIHVSDPIGLLCHRHKMRQELLKSVSSVNGTLKKLNIAVCISGQLRGYKGNLKSLVNCFALDRHTYKVFVHTWNNIGRKFPTPLHASRVFSGMFSKTYYECFVNKPNLQEYIKNSYPNFYDLLVNSSQASLDVLKKEYQTSNVVIDNEDDEPFLTWGNQEKMHYKIYAAHKLAMDSGEQFDLIIRIRPDLKIVAKNPVDLLEIENKSKSNLSIFTVGGFIDVLWHYDYLINDAFAIGIPATMKIYANTYEDFSMHIKNNTYRHTRNFCGHTTLEHNIFFYGVHVDKIQQELKGTLQNPVNIHNDDIRSALQKDIRLQGISNEACSLYQACITNNNN